MKVYVKEIPKSCEECIIADEEMRCMVENSRYYAGYVRRPEWCPYNNKEKKNFRSFSNSNNPTEK